MYSHPSDENDCERSSPANVNVDKLSNLPLKKVSLENERERFHSLNEMRVRGLTLLQESELFYEEGPVELAVLRKRMAAYSLQR
jgi:hypothetical protein